MGITRTSHNESSSEIDSIDLSVSSSPLIERSSEISFDASSVNGDTSLDLGGLMEQFGNMDISKVDSLNISEIEGEISGDQLLLCKEKEDEDEDEDEVNSSKNSSLDQERLLHETFDLATHFRNDDVTQVSGPNISAIERAVDLHEEESDINVTLNIDNSLYPGEGESLTEAINVYSSIEDLKEHLDTCDNMPELFQQIEKALDQYKKFPDLLKRAKDVITLSIVNKSTYLIYPEKNQGERYKMLQRVLEDECSFDSEQIRYHHLVETGKEVATFSCQRKGKYARPLVSFFVDKMSRLEACKLIGRKITKNEWTLAQKHRLYPGVGNPVEDFFQKARRIRVADTTLVNFIEWLKADGHLQNLSFGQKVVKYSNGRFVAIESVKRTDSIKNIVNDYYTKFLSASEEESEDEDIDSCKSRPGAPSNSRKVSSDDSNDDSNDSISDDDSTSDDSTDHYSTHSEINEEEVDSNFIRCEMKCSLTGNRCYKAKGHDKRHGFTPKHLLSPSTIYRLLKDLTSGAIRSRAGLDNIDVKKGSENFEKMRNLASDLSDRLSGDGKSRQDKLVAKIDKVEEFHKVDFERHFKACHGDSKQPKCICLHCGFYDNEHDKIECPKQKDHGPPCMMCQKSFEIIMDLHELHRDIESDIKNNGHQEHPELLDDILSWKEDITICHTNLQAYRAHIVHKFSEADFDKEEYLEIKEGEAVMISDYKMKVLNSKFREAQEDWFAKSGSSLLGFEIHFLIREDGKLVRRVIYHFFISDDTTQDAQAVLCAKHYLYTHVLPKYGIQKVKFRCDGAGCFSAMEAKAAMTIWGDLAEVQSACYETAYKVMVAGCGKTALDGMFGVLTMHLVRLVNYGHSFHGAEELYNLLVQFPLQHSEYHLFRPNRNLLSWPKPKAATQLKKAYLTLYDHEQQTAHTKLHSKIGNATLLTRHIMEGLKKPPKRKKKDSQKKRVHLRIDSNDLLGDARTHITETTFTDDIKKGSAHSSLGFQERRLSRQLDTIDKAEMRLYDQWSKYRKSREDSGLYCCRKVDKETMNGCMCVFATENSRNKHETKSLSACSFPPVDLKTHVQKMHLSGKFAFSLATGTMTNRSDDANTKTTTIQVGTDPRLSHDVDKSWYSDGCYNTVRKAPFVATSALLDDLEALFIAGNSRQSGAKRGQNKYTGDEACTFLRNLKLSNGRRKYSNDSGNENGPLPTASYISSWFSRRKQKMVEQESQQMLVSCDDEVDDDVDINSIQLHIADNYEGQKEASLRATVRKKLKLEGTGERLKEEMILRNQLIFYDELNMTVHEGNNQKYPKQLKKLQKFCNARQLPIGMGIETYISFLRLHDKAHRMRRHSLYHGRILDREIADTTSEAKRLEEGTI